MRVVAYIPDLMFGSGVLTTLRSAGYDTVLVADSAALSNEMAGAELVVVDLTFDHGERIEAVRDQRPEGVPVLAFYSHVEQGIRAEAEQAGFDLVVPRSRMAREGPALVERLLA